MGVMNNGVIQYSVQMKAQHTAALTAQKRANQFKIDNRNPSKLINAVDVKATIDTALYLMVKNHPIHFDNRKMVNVGNTDVPLDLSLDKFNQIFTTNVMVFPGDSDEIGTIQCECVRGRLFRECEDFIRRKQNELNHMDFPRRFQKPDNDLELFEWNRDFKNYEEFAQMTTKTEGFSTGFAFINKNAEGTLPITSEETKNYWISSEILPRAIEQNLTQCFIFTPLGVSANPIQMRGITFNFIPTAFVDQIQARVQDNRTAVGDDGSQRMINETGAEKVVADVLTEVGNFLQPAALNMFFHDHNKNNQIKYSFSNYKYIAS